MPIPSRLVRLFLPLLLIAAAGPAASTMQGRPTAALADKLDASLQRRAAKLSGRTRVIVRFRHGASSEGLAAAIRDAGGNRGRALASIDGHVIDLPNAAIAALSRNPLVERVSLD